MDYAERIAVALEKLVEQNDETMARNDRREADALKRRQTDIARVQSQHADNLESTNLMQRSLDDAVARIEDFKKQLDTILYRVTLLERPRAVGAVDPVGELAKRDPTTRA